jgi:hypothetical protein
MTDTYLSDTLHVLERMRNGVVNDMLTLGHYTDRPGVREAQAGTMATERDALTAAIASLCEQAETRSKAEREAEDHYYDRESVAHGFA